MRLLVSLFRPASRGAALLGALGLGLASSCAVDTAPDGLRDTPPGPGPTVVFDLARAPLPELPLPNDVATFADPTSRTGLRINVSAVAPTALERHAREDFASLEGFSTFAPITVAFSKSPGTDARDTALDLRDVVRRTRGDDWDFRDDPFYVVDLETGVPVPLDLGQGNFPLPVAETNRYWPNDPRPAAETLLFETGEEGFGLGAASYTPSVDTDFDGVLDHPNRLVLAPTGKPGVDDLVPFFDKESDTLVLRPLLPLREKARYAVVLTDRLKGPDGTAVKSPFPAIHHPEQRAAVARVRDVLSDRQLARYYGDLSGTGLEHVAFAWSFTTAPTTEDLLVLRDGLAGKGPFARLAGQFPARATAFRAAGLDDTGEDTGLLADPRCAGSKGRPYLVKISEIQSTLRELTGTLGDLFGGVSQAQIDELLTSLDALEYVVIGEYESPYFLGTPSKEDPNERFRLDFRTGEGRVGRDRVQFWLFVPKKKVDATKPAPTVLWYHGSSLFAAEGILRAGYFAKQGLATFAINLPGHGLPVTPGLQTLVRGFLTRTCMTPWVSALAATRAYDLNGDGKVDPGGYLWTAHAFHSRDNVRQPVVDGLQAVRVLRAFGTASSGQDYDGDGAPNLLGDFDGDGVADVGGPDGLVAAAGNSFGGIVSMVHGAIDPHVAVTAPISGGGGLFDVASRSALTADLVMQQTMTPLVIAVPSASRRPKDGDPTTRCQGEQVSLRFVLNDLLSSREVEIACLAPEELEVGADVVLTNLTNGEVRCGRVGDERRARVPIPASRGDRLDVQVYPGPEAVEVYGKSCRVRPGASPGRRVATFEQAAVAPTTLAENAESCDGAKERTGVDPAVGCAQFQGRFYPVGTALVAPQEGLGLTKGSPELRRLVYLVQTAVDAGDPVSFAPLYLLRPPRDPEGRPMPPRPVVAFNTVGDPFVPVSAGHTFARAAGALPFLRPEAATTLPELAAYATPAWLYDTYGQRTPNQVLVDAWVLEGTARLGRTRAGASCRPNDVGGPACGGKGDPGCATALFDADWLAEGADLWDQAHLPTPLRLARDASVPPFAVDDVARAWRPRELGRPFGQDDGAWTPGAPLVGFVNAYNSPRGVHVWAIPEPCKAFDDPRYYTHLLGRFVASRGTDLLPLSKPATHRCLEDETCPFFVR